MRRNFLWTYGGKRVYLDAPTADEIDPRVIAHSLSLINRWTGHSKHAFSVAQHCVVCSYLVSPEYAATALLHDAHEAFCCDISSPVKREHRRRLESVGDSGYHPNSEMTIDFDIAIQERTGLLANWYPSEVKRADMLMQRLEARLFLDVPESEITEHFGPIPDYAAKMIAQLPGTLSAMFCQLSPREAERDWWERYIQLGGKP